MDIEADPIPASGEEEKPVGEGEREGRREEVGVLPEEKDDRERVRKNGEVVVGSGIPSSSA
jgi:hypothetical protein